VSDGLGDYVRGTVPTHCAYCVRLENESVGLPQVVVVARSEHWAVRDAFGRWLESAGLSLPLRVRIGDRAYEIANAALEIREVPL